MLSDGGPAVKFSPAIQQSINFSIIGLVRSIAICAENRKQIGLAIIGAAGVATQVYDFGSKAAIYMANSLAQTWELTQASANHVKTFDWSAYAQYVKVANTVFPLAEGLSLITTYLMFLVACTIYRAAKTWIRGSG